MKVFIIGAGNLAHYIVTQLKENPTIEVEGGYVRNKTQSKAFIDHCTFPIIDEWTAIPKDFDVYILAVNDSAIESLAQKLIVNQNALVIHCAGSQTLSLLGSIHTQKGIIWPLYSITKQSTYEPNIPLVIDAGDAKNLEQVNLLAQALSNNIYALNFDKRKILHLNAVLVNNFSNHLFAIAATLCQNQNIDFDILKPIINQTATRLKNQSAQHLQTGPAKRGDVQTMTSQLQLLKDHPLWQNIYKAMSESIIAMNEDKVYG